MKRGRLILHRYVALMLLLVLILLVRLPSFFEPHWYDDEEIYLTIGQTLQHGYQLYAEIVDNKPPFLYWWVAFNPSTFWLKLSATLFSLVSVILMYFLALRLKLSYWVVILVSLLFGLFISLPGFEGNILNGELMFLPLSVLGMYLYWTHEDRVTQHGRQSQLLLLGVGGCFGLAGLVKVPVLADLGAILSYVVLTGWLHHKNWRSLVDNVIFLILGALVPWMLISLWFFVHGLLANFVYYTFIYNLQYVNDWEQVTQAPLLVFLGPTWIRVLILLGGLVTIGLSTKIFRFPQPVLVVLLWFWWSWFGSLLSVRPYPHYYLQVAPALTLLIGFFLHVPRFQLRIISGLFIVAFWLFIRLTPIQLYKTVAYYENWMSFMVGIKDERAYYRWFRPEAVEHAAIAAYLRERTTSTDTLFVWGNASAIYSQSQLLPTTPYVTDFLVHSFNSYLNVEQMLRQKRPRYIAVCNQNPTSFNQLFAILNTQYGVLQRFDTCDLYLKTPQTMLQ